MKSLILFLACSFTTGCTVYARHPNGILRIPAVVVAPAVKVRVHRHSARRPKCRMIERKDCYRNRYGHRICKIVRTKRCR